MDKGTDVPRWLLHEQTVRGQLEYTSSRVPSLGEAMFHQKKSQRVPSGRATFATLRNAEWNRKLCSFLDPRVAIV